MVTKSRRTRVPYLRKKFLRTRRPYQGDLGGCGGEDSLICLKCARMNAAMSALAVAIKNLEARPKDKSPLINVMIQKRIEGLKTAHEILSDERFVGGIVARELDDE